MNILNEAAGVARAKIFCSIIMNEGSIKRGVLVSRMAVSEQTFAREYMSYLEMYPNIHYNKESREFEYKP